MLVRDMEILGRPLTVVSEARVRPMRVTKPNKVYLYGRVELSLPPEYIGKRVKVIALIYEAEK